MDLDEGRCKTLHYITIHHKRIDLDEGWCVTLHYITIHHKRINLDEGRCKMHCNGCMNVAWGLCLGGRRSMKPCIFPCKVAAGGDERYLVCAAVAAAVVSVANVFLSWVVVPVCVVLCVFWICGCRSQWNGCMNFCETSSCFEVDNIKNEAILRDFLIFRSWQHQKRSNSARLPHFSKLTTSKTNILCETSFKNGRLSAALTVSYQCVLRFFQSTCLKYCACHEKVMPGHTKCCTCLAESSQQNTEDLRLQNGTPLRKSAPGPPNSSDGDVSCTAPRHGKCIFADPLQLSHACHRFWKCHKNPQVLLTFDKVHPHSLAPATRNDIWTSKSCPNPWCF